MRTRFGWIASVLAMFVIGCNTVDPDECWVNTSGGFGGGGTIPIGAGVGATGSGDFLAPPPGGPLAADGTPNPCVAPQGPKLIEFSPSEFPFVTIVKDDGTGKGAGWQEARPHLEFENYLLPISLRVWYCDFVIGMPLRTELKGKISASLAANLSVAVTQEVAGRMDFSLPPGILCSKFVEGVDTTFKSNYQGFGAAAAIK